MKSPLSLLLLLALSLPAAARAQTLTLSADDVEAESPAESIASLDLSQEVEAMAPEDAVFEPAFDVELPANPNTLRILGRGVAARGSERSIAIACVGRDQSCDRLQFVYIANNQAPVQYLGVAIKAPTAPTGKLRKKALSLVLQEYLDYHETQKQFAYRQNTWYRVAVPTLIGGIGTTIAIPWALSGYNAACAFLSAGGPYIIGGMAVLAFILSSYSVTKMLSSKLVTGDVTFSQQDGWSWASNPRRIKAKKFDELLAGLSAATPNKEAQGYYHYRYDRKKKRLDKQGVQF